MSQPPAIYSYLTEEEAAEHKRLVQLLELARSPEPLTHKELAELCRCAPSTIRYHELNALTKIRHRCPELKEYLENTPKK